MHGKLDPSPRDMHSSDADNSHDFRGVVRYANIAR